MRQMQRTPDRGPEWKAAQEKFNGKLGDIIAESNAARMNRDKDAMQKVLGKLDELESEAKKKASELGVEHHELLTLGGVKQTRDYLTADLQR